MTWRRSASNPQFWALVVSLFLPAAVIPARADNSNLLEAIDHEVGALCQHSRKAVVKVHAERQVQINNLPLAPLQRVGTGFFVSGDGRLLTAATVVADADRCWIEWGDRPVKAEVLGQDEPTNVALLKVDPAQCGGADFKTPALPLGNSDDLRIGSLVVALGFPYEQASAPVVGFVRGFAARHGTHGFVTTHIRAGCKLSPGQGGGPLLNDQGQVVGIAVAAHLDDQCYALPIKAAQKICDDILQHGRPQHAWVGLEVAERGRTNAPAGETEIEVYVQQVISNTPAAEAGFRENDTLERISTNAVHGLADVLDTMFYRHAGDRLEFTVKRGDQSRTLSLVAGTRPQEKAATSRPTLVVPQLVPVSTGR